MRRGSRLYWVLSPTKTKRDAGRRCGKGRIRMSERAVKRAGARKNTERLGTERIGKLLLEFSIPAIVSMVFNSLYNVVDTAFLGHAVGSAGVAVTTLVLPVMTILMGFSMLAGQGGNALAAIQLGEGRKDQVEKTLGNAAALLVLFAAASAVVGTVLIDPLLALIAAPADLWDQPLIISHQRGSDQYLARWLRRDISHLHIVATYNLVFNASLLADEGLGYAFCLDKLINTRGSNLCFRPLSPRLEASACIIWKKYQVFSKAAGVFLEYLHDLIEKGG